MVRPSVGATTRPAGALLAIFVVAACMRPSITSLGPVLSLIGDDTGLSNTELGLLSALPLLAFAAVSPLVHGPSRRFGVERLVALALVGLTIGTLARSLPGPAALWIGTAVLGAAIAVCNVVLPSIVKRDFGDRITLVTGSYSAVMGAFAALASGIALPIAVATHNGWRWSLGVWAVPAFFAAAVWVLRARATPPARQGAEPAGDTTQADGPTAHRSVWRTPAAWAITAYMGLQSTTFYVLVSWLPSIATSHHISRSAAGWYLFLFQVVGLLAGLGLPAVAGRVGARTAAAVATVPIIVACVGLILAPSLFVLWVVLAGIASGSSLVSALSLISLESHSAARATQLSGMAQSIGYLLAAGGPIAAGWLRDTTGSWTAVVALLIGVAVLQATAARARWPSRPPPGPAATRAPV